MFRSRRKYALRDVVGQNWLSTSLTKVGAKQEERIAGEQLFAALSRREEKETRLPLRVKGTNRAAEKSTSNLIRSRREGGTAAQTVEISFYVAGPADKIDGPFSFRRGKKPTPNFNRG